MKALRAAAGTLKMPHKYLLLFANLSSAAEETEVREGGRTVPIR